MGAEKRGSKATSRAGEVPSGHLGEGRPSVGSEQEAVNRLGSWGQADCIKAMQ